jgi:hypothetical protein
MGFLRGGPWLILCCFELASYWLVLDDELLFCLVLELALLVNHLQHAKILIEEESAQMEIS